MAWASQRSFPSAADFPGGKIPKTLESRATSTINDDPHGKKISQTEYLMVQIDGPSMSATEKRTAIDSRPSPITELHRAWMHEAVQNTRNLSSNAACSTVLSIDNTSDLDTSKLQNADADPQSSTTACLGEGETKAATAKRRWRK